MCDSEFEEGEMTVRLSAASNSPRSIHGGTAHGIPEWNLVEAVLWHGGQGASAAEYFRHLSKADRDALVAFLNSL